MNELEQTLTSLEVAEMVEKTHANLLKDIRRYCKQLGEVKIDFTDFFTKQCGKPIPLGVGWIAHLRNGHKMAYVEYFVKSTYINKIKIVEEFYNGK